ncbi:MAG: choice-of-anchor V domain-containing protein, partial [Ignavibacteria bacterium]
MRTFKKILIFSSVITFLLIIAVKLYSSSNGITDLTKKTGAIGCACHGNHKPSPNVSVFFSGPDSVAAGETKLFMIKLARGPAITGGFDVASYSGTLDTTYLDTTVRRDSSNGELTHRFPKSFVNDTVFWTFKYTAPNTPQIDTLYAVANSTNNDGKADTLDQWNFSVNRTVRVYLPIGILSNELKVNTFILFQNYPNPFNANSKIKFQISK